MIRRLLSIIYYCRQYPRMYPFQVVCIFLLFLDTEHDIGGEEFYYCVPATNWYADLFYESFTERIIVQKNVAFARYNNRKRRMIFFFSNSLGSKEFHLTMYMYLTSLRIISQWWRVANIWPIWQFQIKQAKIEKSYMEN